MFSKSLAMYQIVFSVLYLGCIILITLLHIYKGMYFESEILCNTGMTFV